MGVSPASTPLTWVDTRGSAGTGVSWGVPWPRGSVARETAFGLRDADGDALPVQTRVLATWPDGSLKWTGHATVTASESTDLTLIPGEPAAAPSTPVMVEDVDGAIVVDTGTIRATVPTSGRVLISTLERDGRAIAVDGRLISELSHDPEGRGRTPFQGDTESVEIERSGPVQTVVLVTGRHTDGERRWLPFRIRLYFHAGSDRIRVVHSLVWDGDAETDFLCGLGIRFDVPLSAPGYDRHIRIAGTEGFLTEAVQPLTGLWKNPGAAAISAQLDGRAAPPIEEWPQAPSRYDWELPSWQRLMQHVPVWSDWALAQLSADGYSLRKRTGADHGWVPIPGGRRSRGYAYLGQADGGLEIGLRGFWQSHPTQLDIRNAASDLGTITMWLWSPQAPPMDVRFYHAGVHEQDAAGQIETVELTYEDYRPGYGDAHGVGRTHELFLRVADATPDHETLDRHAAECETPPQLVCPPERLHAAGVFGDWALPDRSAPAKARIEDRLDLVRDFYLDQVEERRWYGFWDYGDVMHSYDVDRHTWRYDIGGYAWDNSELSTDIWLWTTFLRTGDARTYRLAEAMTRHTGEVDTYHAGRFAGLGTRHNVQHWGCSCKQLRISNAYYRRYLYFLAADDRVGDLLDEVVVTDRTFIELDRNRSIGDRRRSHRLDPTHLEVDLGIDFGSMLSSWLTQWERSGDDAVRQRIVNALTDIARLPHGFFTGIAHFDVTTGHFDTTEVNEYISHLSSVFGIVETLSELLDLVDAPEFEAAWLEYCRLYLGTPEEQLPVLGHTFDGALKVPHSRLLAWAARRTGDAELAERAWHTFFHSTGDRANLNDLDPATARRVIDGPRVAERVSEILTVSTNDAAQFGLAAIQNLALIGDALDTTPGRVSDR